MKHVNWLYYTKKESTQKLTSKETGQIDVSAYLNGQPKFFIDSESAQKIPKKIIIGDLDLTTLGETDAIKFFLVLNELCRTGFEIYVPKNGYLEYIDFFKFIITHKDIKKEENFNISVELPPSEQYFTLNNDKAIELAQLFDSLSPDSPYIKELLILFVKICSKKNSYDSDDEDDVDDKYLDKDNKYLIEHIKNPIEYFEVERKKPLNDPKAR